MITRSFRLLNQLLTKQIVLYPIADQVTPEQIVKLLDPYGAIRTIEFFFRDDRRSPRVNVQFHRFESVAAILNTLQHREYNLAGIPISIWTDCNRKWVKQRFGFVARGHGTRIFIENLSPSTLEQQLRNHFSKFGPLLDVNLFVRKGVSMSKATVTFAKLDDANSAISLIKSTTLDGSTIQYCLDPTFSSLGDALIT
uniref:RRM domain-containing protein n=1 Tax=Spongospora subterranea TaxID=70186 RepID=A0A0H5QN63_9EUKA|eukprot:CRZ03443.1 hypothetical protein [Spongospora subterranea]